MNIHEYQAKELMTKFGVANPPGGVASTARGAAGFGARAVSVSAAPAGAGDHGRSTPLGLTASTAKPEPARRSAVAPCSRKRSPDMTDDEPRAATARRRLRRLPIRAVLRAGTAS